MGVCTPCMPEMLRAPLAMVVLYAKMLDLDEPRRLLSHSLDPPTFFTLANTILSLKEIGALVNDDSSQVFDGKLTDLGKIMAHLPVGIRISKLIMLGHVFGVLRDAIILGASMAVKDVFFMEHGHPTVSSYTTRKKWAHTSDSDCIATLNVYKTWQNEKANRRVNTPQAEKQWCQRNGLQIKALREMDALVREITRRLLRLGIQESIGVTKVIWQGADREFVLKVILAGAFYPTYFVKRLQTQETWEENISTTLSSLDPTKTVSLRGWPRKQPGYLYAKNVQEIFSKHLRIPEKQIAIFFTTSRIYVQFREKETARDDSLQTIAESVYQAVMMKHCNILIEIKLLTVKEANKRARYYTVHNVERTFFERTDINMINARSREEKKFYEEEHEDNACLLEYPTPPREEDCTFSVKLQGPDSPLEMELRQLTLDENVRKIRVDRNSVNSVLLANDLTHATRLLVAQSLTQSAKNFLTLRATTFLPNIPGLAASTLALIFARCVELRCNPRETSCTGALCGLGPIDTCRNRAMFPEHDMEIPFNVDITRDDVKEINELRHWMNRGMRLDNSSDEDIIRCQTKIKHILLNVRDKQRHVRDAKNDESARHSTKWTRYDRPPRLSSVQNAVTNDDVYPLHNVLELPETTEQMEEDASAALTRTKCCLRRCTQNGKRGCFL